MTTSRYTIMEAPAKDPGCCLITRTSVGPFIDTGVDLSVGKIDRGRVYLSVDAVREMAQLAGLFDEGEPQTAALKKKQWYQEGYNDALREFENVEHYVSKLISNSASTAGAAVPGTPETGGESAGAAVTDAASAAGVTQSVDSNSDESERKGSSARRVKRLHDLPTSSGDESAYRL